MRLPDRVARHCLKKRCSNISGARKIMNDRLVEKDIREGARIFLNEQMRIAEEYYQRIYGYS